MPTDEDLCFACDNVAVTREHVPPLCLFPEAKDAHNGLALRKNLITVPACAEHNLDKSRDDQYLFLVLSINVAANPIGTRQAFTKLARSHRRRPALGESVLDAAPNVIVIDSHSGTEHEASEAALDGARFQRILNLIALGIFRHHFGRRWLGHVRVHADFIGSLEPDTVEVQSARLVLFDSANALFASDEKHGDNPEVFWYQAHESLMPAKCMVRLAFYGGCTATAFFNQ